MFLLHDFCNFQKNAWSEEEKNYTLKHKRSLSIFEKYTVTDRSWLTQCNFVGANTWHFILQFSFQVCIKNSTKKSNCYRFESKKENWKFIASDRIWIFFSEIGDFVLAFHWTHTFWPHQIQSNQRAETRNISKIRVLAI